MIAIVLLSGGLDSATTLAIAKAEGFTPYALSFRYGQRHHWEIIAAQRVAASLGATRHRIIDIDLRQFGGSALTDDLAVPKQRSLREIEQGIPITYVPARNTIFLSYALAWAEVAKAQAIFIGVNAIDYSGYPDCRPAYLAAYQQMANLATKAAVEENRPIKILAPLLYLNKADIIRRGLELGIDYRLTSSCYDPDEKTGAACGQCDACLLRRKGFAEAGLCE